ncbi:MAG: NAD(P)-dependent oxidoreductase [Firmicutes bacterium HGW-Firmicutes-20]|nr:MAG: NAD(P)-dependent oxidoreductase [Firmicutes bacterium HGW-Firmicutes-20]PKM90457.1 MAG: NAD(P)-dependent oxidoreductase [Firmicutes bacterium HGW-Firmicutes-10]
MTLNQWVEGSNPPGDTIHQIRLLPQSFLFVFVVYNLCRGGCVKVLLTGACGAVGHHAIPLLINQGFDVTVFELKTKKNIAQLNQYNNKAKIIYGNITDRKAVFDACRNQDAIIHLAGIIPPLADSEPKLTYEVNYEGTKNIVDAIIHNGHGFLMFASSISVYGDRVDDYHIKVSDTIQFSQDDYYAYVKKMTEDMIIESGIEYTIFRLTAIMDTPRIDPLMFHMPLDTKIEIASARDTARAFVSGLKKFEQLRGRIFNLGGGESCRCTYRDLLKSCFTIYGLNYKYLDEKAFADRNFHCGYYIDGDELNEIISFRQDTLETYYNYLRGHVSFFQKQMSTIFSYFIISHLNQKSEPRIALKSNNTDLIKKYFR